MHASKLLIFSSCIAGVIGCGLVNDSTDGHFPDSEVSQNIDLTICKQWINANLDLEKADLTEYHVSVNRLDDASGGDRILVQFAHKTRMAENISEFGIEAILGGFPDYFTITLNADGSRVIDHYASRE